MKKVLKIALYTLVIGIFLLSVLGFVILKTTWWQTTFLAYVNRQLGQRYNLALQVKEFRGNLFFRLRFSDWRLLTDKQTPLLQGEELNLTYNLKALLKQKPTIQAIQGNGISLTYPNSLDSLRTHLALYKDTTRALQLTVKKIKLTDITVLASDSINEALVKQAYMQGTLSIVGQELTAEFDSLGLALPRIQEKLLVRHLNLVLRQDTLWVKDCQLKNRAAGVRIAGQVLLRQPIKSHLAFQVDNLLVRERLAAYQKIFALNDFLNLRGEADISSNSVDLSAQFDGKFRNRSITAGRIKGSFINSHFQIKNFACKVDSEEVQGILEGDFNQKLEAVLNFKGLNAYDWGVTEQTTNLTGSLFLSSLGQLNRPERITAQVDLNDATISTFNFNRIHGTIVYEKGYLTITDTLHFQLGETELMLDGLVDLNDNTLDTRAYFKNIDANLAANWLKLDTLLGKVDGFIEATGSLSAPDLRGWIKGKAFGVPNLVFSEGIARFGLVNLQQHRFGDIFIEATNARIPLIAEEIPLTSLIVRFEGDTTIVQSLKIVSDNLDIEAQGRVVNFTEVNLQSIKIRRGANLLSSIDPIHFSLDKDTLQLNQVRFALNQGRLTLSAKFLKRIPQDIKVEFADLSLEPLNQFIKGTPDISGKLQGVIEYHNGIRRPYFKGNLVVDNARFLGQRFKRVNFNGKLSEHRLEIEQVTIQDMQKGVLNGQGFVGCNFNWNAKRPLIVAQDSVNLTLNLDDFDLKVFQKFLRQQRAIDGKLSGNLIVYNFLGAPRLSYDFELAKPIFDKLKGETLKIKGIYQDNKLTFSDIQLLDEGGVTRGRGYFGTIISLFPLRFEIGQDAPISMNFTMHTTALNFLSAYIKGLESATGNFDLALSISGTPRQPIRSGNLIAKDATLNISTLENPITGVAGSAVLRNNILEIVTLTGFMKKPLPPARFERLKDKIKAYTWDIIFPPKVAPEQPNLVVTGNIDFSSFFHPKYDIKVKGEELYLRTLLAEQEGVLDAEISLRGRDSLLIDGELDIIDFVLRNEFTSSSKIQLPPAPPSSTYTSVNLHTVIPGNFYFQNSQLDCELEGEIWIIQTGDEPYRFAGTLDVRKGKFFYYGWEFEILNGTIVFEPTEFNPILDIEAQVDLAAYGLGDTTISQSSTTSEYAIVKLTGYLDDPALSFESQNYSQSDILMFLTRTQNLTSQGLSQENISADALNMFGMYFERQLEKNITRLSGLDEFELRTRGNLLANQQPEQWSILLGRKIAPNLYFKYERTFSLAEPYQQFGLEYRLNRNMSLVGDVDQNGSLRINYRFRFRY